MDFLDKSLAMARISLFEAYEPSLNLCSATIAPSTAKEVKQVKQKKMRRKKIYAILCLFICAGVALSIVSKKAEDRSQTLVREREYPAQIGTITVGIDAAGSVNLKDTEVYLPSGLKIADFCVDPGDEIKEGDPIANVDPLSIRNVREQLEEECEELLNALNKQTKARNTYLTNSSSNIQHLRENAVGDAKKAQTNQKNYIAALEKQIESTERRIENLNDLLEDLNPQKAGENERISSIQETQEAYIALRDQLLERLEEANDKLDILTEERESAGYKETAYIEYLAGLDQLESEVELAQSRYDQAAQSLETVESLLLNPVLLAPEDGVVRSLDVEPQTEIAQSPIMKIGTRTPMSLTLPIESADINEVTVGQKVEFYTDAHPAEKFTGTVTGKNLLPNSEGKYEVYVQIDSTDAQLQQGMGAMATLIVMQKENVLTLSNKAISLRDGRQYVNVRNADGTLSEREITTGFSDGRVSEILSGLTAGEVAIVEDEIS